MIVRCLAALLNTSWSIRLLYHMLAIPEKPIFRVQTVRHSTLAALASYKEQCVLPSLPLCTLFPPVSAFLIADLASNQIFFSKDRY